MAETLSKAQSTGKEITEMSWAEEKGHESKIKRYEAEVLNRILEDFYAAKSKRDGRDYETDSPRVMATAIDHNLRRKGFKFSITRVQKVTNTP